MEITSAATRTIHISYINTVVSFLFVVLKFAVRSRVSRKTLGWDDSFVALSWVVSIPLTISIYFEGKHGMGRHAADLPVEELVEQTRWFWVSIWLYVTALGLSKISILMQYLRIFIARRTVVAIWICLAFVAAYTVQGIFVGIFQCTPPIAFWDRSVTGFCIDQVPYFFIAAGLNIATDFAVILIPVPALRTLHVSRSRKIGLFLVFAMGGFGCVISLIRIHALAELKPLVESGDVSFGNSISAMWSVVEVHICIMCACLPSLRPVLTRFLVMTGLSRSSNPGKTPSQSHGNGNTPSYPSPNYQRDAWPRRDGSLSILGVAFFGSAHPSARASAENPRSQGAEGDVELGNTKERNNSLGAPQLGQISVETTLEVHSTVSGDRTLVGSRTGSAGGNRSSRESEEIRLVPEAHRGWYHAQIERDRR
ncbi:hypothetical protein GTA08_BOTSDO12777 [Neofusicoccum parvum]|uniref:Uncharacterized protein n=1 Tax=Neofusicoccum parvum TaxID=310453 RepID=A0ACB5S8B3_9PEZI|nr:hypothetical protein GTA08_BOTSDO12777 [Neofusicoccum parvum]